MTMEVLEETKRVIEAIQPAVEQAGYGIVSFDSREVAGYINYKPTGEETIQITVSIMPRKYSYGV